MDASYLLEILKKYREGTATPEEEQFLLRCYDAFESQPDVVSMLTEAERERLKRSLHSGVMAQIAAQAPAPPVKKHAGRWLRAAAAVILLAGAGTAGVLVLRQSAPQHAATAPQQSVQPEKENNLIALPDGSSVLVSAGSRLRYPATFERQPAREVYLEGKALFTVQQQSGQPFIVHAGRLQTTVLGTTFEITAPPAGDVTVTVLRGRVQVAGDKGTLAVLSANQQIVYDSGAGGHRQLQVPDAPPPAWQQEDLLFDDVTLQQAALLLEDRFDTHISIPDETLQQQRFSTTFLKNESLEQVLKSICAFNRAAYQRDREKNTVIIYRP